MILLVSPSKPLQFTPKGTPRRQAILQDYEVEINTLYETIEQVTADASPTISEWKPDVLTPFIRDTVSMVLQKSIGDDDDIFQHGGDR